MIFRTLFRLAVPAVLVWMAGIDKNKPAATRNAAGDARTAKRKPKQHPKRGMTS